MTATARAIATHPFLRDQRVRALLLVLAGVLVYLNGLDGPFIMDDENSVVTNQQIRRLTPITEPLSPPPETPVAGRPLVNLTFAINYAMGELDVRVYHATNLAIHLLAALVLLGVVRRTLEREGIPPRLREHASPLAGVITLFWLLHPLQSEVVNYVSQRTTALMGLMFLLTLYCSVRALEESAATRGRVAHAPADRATHRPRGGRGKETKRPPANGAPARRHVRRWQIAAIVACAAGMASKETMVTAPLIVVLYDRVFVYSTLREAWRERWPLYTGLAAGWILLALLMAQGHRGTVGFGAGVDWWTYLLNQVRVISDYLRLTFLPRELVADYGIPQPLTPGDVLRPALLLLSIAGLTVAALIKWPRAAFLGIWFFITLAPHSSIVPIATEVGAERRMYLPLAAITTFVVYVGWIGLSALHVTRAVVAAITAVIAVGLGAGTVVRNDEYESRLTLAETVIERRPHGRAFLRMAALLIEAGRRPEGLDYLHKAKSANAVGARFLLGNEYIADGKIDAAITELREFLRRHPRHASVRDARLTLARALVARGHFGEAAAEYALFLEDAPRHLLAREEMGGVLLAVKRPLDALPHLEAVAAAKPNDVNALGKLGTALALTRRFGDAVTILTRAVNVDPQHAQARTMLGRALASQGRFEEAYVQLQQAVKLAPGNDEATRDLNAIAARLGRSSQAR